MEDITFNSLEELYERLKPALVTKAEEMKRAGYDYIKPEDVWNYLKESKWKSANNLALHEMVDDILNSEEILIDNYLREKLNRGKRKLYFDENYQDENDVEELWKRKELLSIY